MPVRGLGEPGQNNPRSMFKRLSNTLPAAPPAQLKMQNFLKRFAREVDNDSGRGLGWEGLGERWCETSKPMGLRPMNGTSSKIVQQGSGGCPISATFLAVIL